MDPCNQTYSTNRSLIILQTYHDQGTTMEFTSSEQQQLLERLEVTVFAHRIVILLYGLVMVVLAVGFVLVRLLVWHEKRKLTRRTRRCQQSALDSAERGHNGTPDILNIPAPTSTPRPSNIPSAAWSGAGGGHSEVLQPLLAVTPHTSVGSTRHVQASNAERGESEPTEKDNVDQEATGCSIATATATAGDTFSREVLACRFDARLTPTTAGDTFSPEGRKCSSNVTRTTTKAGDTSSLEDQNCSSSTKRATTTAGDTSSLEDQNCSSSTKRATTKAGDTSSLEDQNCSSSTKRATTTAGDTSAPDFELAVLENVRDAAMEEIPTSEPLQSSMA